MVASHVPLNSCRVHVLVRLDQVDNVMLVPSAAPSMLDTSGRLLTVLLKSEEQVLADYTSSESLDFDRGLVFFLYLGACFQLDQQLLLCESFDLS